MLVALGCVVLPVFLLAETAAEDSPLICSFPDEDFVPALFAEKVANDRHAFGRIWMLYFFCFPVVFLAASVGAILPAFASDERFLASGQILLIFSPSLFLLWNFYIPCNLHGISPLGVGVRDVYQGEAIFSGWSFSPLF